MKRLLLLAATLPLASCDTIDDYFSPMAAEALLIGIEELPPEVDYEIGAAATSSAFIARATSLTDVEANLVDDAERVTIARGDFGSDMANLGSGLYEVDSSTDASLEYVVGHTYILTVVDEGRSGDVRLVAPPPPELVGVPAPTEPHPAGQAIYIDLTGQGFDNYVAVVATSDVDGNVDLTHDSRPTTAGDYVDWIRSTDEVGVVEIPGTAFPASATPYVVGVAGVIKARDADFDDLNPLVSNFAAGSLATAVVTTAP